MDLTSVAPCEAGPDARFDVVHADMLRGFPDLVRELGGDPAPLLSRAGLEPEAAASGALEIGYRGWVNVLELAAAVLQRPDFALRLARLQGGAVFGPIGVVMRNSGTFGQALEYVASHCHAHSLAACVRLDRDRESGAVFAGHEILLDRMPNRRQAIEQILLLGHLNAQEITGGRARARAVRFRHQPLSSPRAYRRYFGCDVLFEQSEDGLVFSERDMRCPIAEPDVQLYEMATAFIDTRFTRVTPPMHAQVRALILQFMETEDCSNERIAAELGLHPRTLHRRLKAEGRSFEGVKDEVRRDVALRYLKETDFTLTLIAQKLGYSEHSVLSRSCLRWFSASPSRVRAQAGRQAPSPQPSP